MVSDIFTVRRRNGSPLQTSTRCDLLLITPVRFDRPKIRFTCGIAGVEDPPITRPGKIEVPPGSRCDLNGVIDIVWRGDIDVRQCLKLDGCERFAVIRDAHRVVAVDIAPEPSAAAIWVPDVPDLLEG